MLKNNEFEIWITFKKDCPDFDDIVEAQYDLENRGIDYQDKLGIGFTKKQWLNFLDNLSRFEYKMVSLSGYPNKILGFPVKIIENVKY